MTKISDVNNIQMLNICDKLEEAFNASKLSIDKFSAEINIPRDVIEEMLSKTVSDKFTVIHMVRLSKYLKIRICDLF